VSGRKHYLVRIDGTGAKPKKQRQQAARLPEGKKRPEFQDSFRGIVFVAERLLRFVGQVRHVRRQKPPQER